MWLLVLQLHDQLCLHTAIPTLMIFGTAIPTSFYIYTVILLYYYFIALCYIWWSISPDMFNTNLELIRMS